MIRERGKLSGVFKNRWRSTGGWRKNPARGIEKASEQITKPGILTLPEAEALLRATGANFVPAIAVGLFAGLGSEAELWHLDWKSINLADTLIDVTKSTLKT